MLQRLLVAFVQFLEPFLRTVALTDTVQLLYKGLLRVLLVLLHDFPEFLCEYHFSLCDVIPSTCIQLRNLILSAFPRAMRLPDPFTPRLKVDLLPEIQVPPLISSNYTAALHTNGLRADIDQFFRTRDRRFLTELAPRLMLPAAGMCCAPCVCVCVCVYDVCICFVCAEAQRAGTKYSVPVMNALVLCCGVQAVSQPSKQAQSVSTAACMDVYLYLATELDARGALSLIVIVCACCLCCLCVVLCDEPHRVRSAC